MNLWNAHPDQLIDAMEERGLHRAWLVTSSEGGRVEASDPLLGDVARAVGADRRDYHGHEGVFLEIGRESRHLLSAAVHRTRRGQAAGGVRFWTYDTLEDFLRDGLRLARGMGHKNALAGLWWGGGKGVVARRPGTDHRDPGLRAKMYRDYGRFISGIQGCYITAEDAGTTTDDMAVIFSKTRHTTCIPERLGGSGNPSILTALGVVVGMEAALEHRGEGSLQGRTVAVQGAGNVSRFMIGDLLERGVKRVVVADIDAQALERCRQRYAGDPVELREVAPGDTSILAEPCDVLAPNAVGAILNDSTIPGIQAPVVCGAANNQLEDPPRDAAALHERGTLYVPDFLCNRMGIVNCANEQYGTLERDPAIWSHLEREPEHGIYQRSLEIYRRAEASGQPPAFEAQALADELAEELHPLWGHRGLRIIRSLVETGWSRGEPLP